MQNQVFNGLALIAAAIAVYGLIGLFGNRYTLSASIKAILGFG